MDIKELNIFLKDSSQIRHPWEVARFNAIKDLLSLVEKRPRSDFSILDVGCGDGYVIQQLSHYWPTFSYVGVDSALTYDQVQQLQMKYPDTQMDFYSNLSDIQPTKIGTIDLVLLLDVLEHVEDDAALLKEVSSWIRKDGYVLITVPAFQFLYCDHDRWLGHYRRYSKKMLITRIRQAGFTSVISGHLFSGLFLPRLYCKTTEIIFNRHNQRQKGIGQWEWGKNAARVVGALLSWNAYVDVMLSKMGIPQLGLSVFSLCRK